MKKSMSLVALVFFFISTSVLAADNLKIGVVNTNQILQKSPLMITMNESLAKKFKPRQDEINKANNDLVAEASQLDTSANMSADDRAKLQDKILADRANVQILTASFQRDLAIEKAQLLQTFTTKLTNVINKIATDGSYDLIEQQTNLLYINNKLDITPQVLKEMV